MADFDTHAAALARPETHGLAPGTAVERIDTHTAAVFLIGDRAFKLRRPVDYGFLDYSTRAKRRAAALRELHDNQRGAPGLYLGLAGLTEAGALIPPPAPETTEPVVLMHRFDEATLFDRMAAEGRLDRALLHATGRSVAAMHRAAPERPCLRPLPDLALAEVGAIDALAPVIGAGPVAETAPLLRQHGRALAGTAANRPARRCHGDLHLRNVMIWQGRPAPFDCIDFNDELTDIDPLYDLAFLLMDLDHRGLGALGTTCLNAWAERLCTAPHGLSDTAYGGLGILPLYKACRAAIRAKVAGLTAETCDDPEAAEEARVYLALAHRYLATPHRPRLIAVGGLSGSGKSTLARALAGRLGADGTRTVVVLRSDAIRKGLWGAEETARLPHEAYSRDASATVYAELLSRARTALGQGAAVILDAAHLRQEERAAAEDLAAETGLSLTGFWLDAPLGTLRDRVEAREGDVSDADARVVTLQSGIDPGEIGWTRLAAGEGPDRVAAAALDAISESGA